jgi:hypothetical protein
MKREVFSRPMRGNQTVTTIAERHFDKTKSTQL